MDAAVDGGALFEYALRLADNACVLAHRLCEWSGEGPTLEEDLALSNMGLDLLGQARSFYSHAAEVEGMGRDEDWLAYRRDAAEYRNLLLVELPNGDFAQTMLRQLLFAAWAQPAYAALAQSSDATLAAIAAKAEREMAYHLRHCAEWVIRLGDGTEESHRRAAGALELLWPYTGELFERDAVDDTLIAAGVAFDPGAIKGEWEAVLDEVFARATLSRPADAWMQRGGRLGRHSEHLGHLLAEMQYLQRSYPDARW